MDGYECNLLLVLSGGFETKLFLFLGSLESGERERAGSVLATQGRAAAGNKTAAQRS